jgi:dTDP-4-amino-4,6-dideoxygalactose transaminase
MKDSIYVTKSFLPPLQEYVAQLEKIWDSGQLTNQGPMLKKFENQVEEKLKLKNFHFVANGTLALQVALRSLDVQYGDEIITTPFSYVATTSAILWERAKPIFVDVRPDNFCIDVDKIEAAITPRTKAILAVHVFGIPCDVERIQAIADQHELKTVYDGAHAFGVEYNGKSLLSYGDITTCSFHATKLMHTIEGGGVVVSDDELSEKVELIKRFGHNNDEHMFLGMNAKANEFQAAMGIVNLQYLPDVIARRQAIVNVYDYLLNDITGIDIISRPTGWNYGYYPVLFDRAIDVDKTLEKMNADGVYPRRYFYPSLNTLTYIKPVQKLVISESISKRVLCLPLYDTLSADDAERICSIIKKVMGS